ncbi:MAG: immune inhibitor A, partial [Thermoplasmata archaeon]|nr:immune inhibitor A [Thermoplasmata archaeon]
VRFYTACDEDYMYVAFENDTGDLYTAKIDLFIDKNENGVWDGVPTDDRFIVYYGNQRVKDYNGNDVDGSLVGWNNGYGVEIRIPKVNWSDCEDWAFNISYLCAPGRNPSWGDESAPMLPTSFLIHPCECSVCFKALVSISKLIPGDFVTIYHTDFENPANVTNEWIAYSLDSESDTWTLSEKRSHSSSHSYRCTGRNTTYLGNAYDILEMKHSVDLSNANNVTFSFWHWCKGDSYDLNGHLEIADYGDVEISNDDGSTWISLSDLGVSELYYDNDWTETSVTIEATNTYPGNISGEDLLSDHVKFRFVWRSDPQFQYEGWYIDDVSIVVGEKPSTELVFQTHDIPCIPFGSSTTHTFPIPWVVNEEGKYLVEVLTQEEPPYIGVSYNSKIVTIGNIHDLAVISLVTPDTIERGDDLPIDAVVKNLGTYNETNVQVKATVKNKGGTTVWSQTVQIPLINISEERAFHFTWENATYCDYNVEVRVIHPDDEVPENNAMNKWIIVTHTIFEDDVECGDCSERFWTHFDLTGGEGHWHICTSGYDHYLWCGVQNTTKYGNNWNDVAMIKNPLDLSNYTTVTLSFKTYCEIAENDYGYVEVSSDGGGHWSKIKEYTGKLNWTDENFDISAYKSDEFVLRFRFVSDENLTWRGWIINDVVITGDGSPVFSDDFESGTGKWIIEYLKAGDWWHITTRRAYSGSHSWWCGDELTGTYPANLNNVLLLNETIDLTKAFEADILFMTWYNLSTVDVGYLEVSDDNGATWNVVDTFTGESSRGSTPKWIKESYPLDPWIGGEIQVRFRFVSDSSLENEGWYIDDVKIVGKIDNEPPITTYSISGTMGLDDWYVSPVTITLTATDGDGSGVDHTYYRLDGGTQVTYSSPFTVSDSGLHTVEYWSVDKVGNTESHHTESFKIDVDNPTIEITQPISGLYFHGNRIWPVFNRTLFNWTKPIIIGNITIKTSADDDTSGVDRVEFYVDGVLKETDTVAPYEWTWDETAFFTHTISVKVYDKAGHSVEASRDVRIFNFKLGSGATKPSMLKGKVYENGTLLKKGIGGATVTVLGEGINTTTGSMPWNKGKYSLTLDPGTYSVKFEAEGYETKIITGVVIEAGKTTKLDVALVKTE